MKVIGMWHYFGDVNISPCHHVIFPTGHFLILMCFVLELMKLGDLKHRSSDLDMALQVRHAKCDKV